MTDHFIIVGAQRSGTTGLYRLLAQHPDICMASPLRPEPKFFLREDAVNKGREGYLARHFSHHNGESMLGEKSTSYMEREDAILRIRSVLPEARLMFVLRNPVLRAYSNWRFSRSHGIEPLDFKDALEAETTRVDDWDTERFSVCPYAYATRGHYPRYLKRWAAYFSRENIILVTSEHLFNDPAAVRTILARLGVNPNVPLHLPGKVNASTVEGHTRIPETLLRHLYNRYRDDIRQLTEDWGMDTTPWHV